MKVGVISDTHGNLSGLIDAVDFLRNEERVSKIFFLGHEYGDVDKLLDVKSALKKAKKKDADEETSELSQSLFDELARQKGLDPSPKVASKELDEVTWLKKQLIRIPGQGDPEALFGHINNQEFELVGGRIICAVHNPKSLDKEDIASAGIVLYGHTHLYQVDKMGQRYFVNPGHMMETEDKGRPATFGVLDLGDEPKFVVFDLNFEVVQSTPLELEKKRKFSVS